MADMEAVGGGIEARIGHGGTRSEGVVEPFEVGALVQEAASGEHLKARRLRRGHFGLPSGSLGAAGRRPKQRCRRTAAASIVK
jgi:hypothetical protein